jgi:hypothetical protein
LVPVEQAHDFGQVIEHHAIAEHALEQFTFRPEPRLSADLLELAPKLCQLNFQRFDFPLWHSRSFVSVRWRAILLTVA